MKTGHDETDPFDEMLKEQQQTLFNNRAVTAAWLDQQDFPPLEWAVEGLLPEGMGLLAAPPKAGKSWLVADIGLACASGGVALGVIPVKKRPVLYLALEDGHRRLQSRFRTLMGGQPLPEALQVVTKAAPDETLPIIEEFLSRNKGDTPLVIVDTLGKVKPDKSFGQDSYQSDYRFGGSLKKAIDEVSGGCLLLVHHTRKMDSADFLNMVSGTQGLAGSADFVAVLSRNRHEKEGVLAITGRDVAEEQYAIDSSTGTGWRLSGDSLAESAKKAVAVQQAGRLGEQQKKALIFVNSHPEGIRAKDLAAHLEITDDDAGKILRRLESSDHIRKPSRGVFAPVASETEVSETSERPKPGETQGQNTDEIGRVIPLRVRKSETADDRSDAERKRDEALREMEAAKKELESLNDTTDDDDSDEW